jgi:hypothetical protein
MTAGVSAISVAGVSGFARLRLGVSARPADPGEERGAGRR